MELLLQKRRPLQSQQQLLRQVVITSFPLINKMCFTNRDTLYMFSVHLLDDIECNDKEHWCAFYPDCSKEDVKIACPKHCNTCRGNHQPENIEYHKLCHSPENKFKCPECEEIFSRWKVVLLHLWKCHSIDIELFSCTLCDYKSSKSELLKFHMETHSSERPCLCDLCGKGFKNMKQMRNHRVIPYKFNQFLFKIA